MNLADRRELLAAVLDVLIPADAGFPPAGTIALEHVLSAAVVSAESEALLGRALRAIAEGAADFSRSAPTSERGSCGRSSVPTPTPSTRSSAIPTPVTTVIPRS